MITNYDKLLCKSLCDSPSNQFPTQIDQAPVGEEDELLTTVSIKIMARFPTTDRSRVLSSPSKFS